MDALALAAQEQLVPGDTWPDKLGVLEELRYDAIEVWGSSILEDDTPLARAVSGSPVAVSAITSGYRGGLLDPSPAERTLANDDLKRLLESSERLGADGVIVVPAFGDIPLPDLAPLISARDLATQLLIAQLRELVEWLAGMRSKIILEPLNRYEARYLTSVGAAVEIASAIGSPNIGVLVDLFHANIEERGIVEAVRQAGDWIAYVHLADSGRGWPGTGHTDFVAARDALRAIGYTGYSSTELFEVAGGDQSDELRRVRELWS
jgi:sugar phosphate isomerase/epimerase